MDKVFLWFNLESGGPALSRRGDFSVSNTGLLIDGAGSKVLDNARCAFRDTRK